MLIATTSKRQASWSFTNVTQGLTKANVLKQSCFGYKALRTKERKSHCRGCERVLRLSASLYT